MARAQKEEIDAPRQLPRVDDLLNHPVLQDDCALHGRTLVKTAIRRALDWARERLTKNPITQTSLLARVQHEESVLLGRALTTVINATGVVLHTNLGRAPMASHVIDRIGEVATRYSALEFSIETGKRGPRSNAVTSMLTTLTGAQAALCVNNNAAAVLLALAATAQGGEVIVSRGELVEIGGSFRMPDVMEISRAKLVEVGTTNRTRSGDYERALSPNTKAILRVHRGNFRIDGFVESPDLLEVSKLAHDANIPVIVDLGHGSLHDLGFPSNDGLPGCVQQCLEKGADLVLGSGDKLLGGPQAGIAVGSKDLIERMRKHPLHRALRIDKLTTAALEVVLHDHLSERTDRVPALAMISKTPENLKSTSERLHATWMDAIKSEGDASRIEMRPSPCVSHVGGGSDAHYQLDSYGLALKSVDRGPNFVLDKLRTLQPPVIARIHEDEIILDLRTVQDDELETLIQQLVTLALS